ncbi:hypothetical protein E2C01_064763 [Portunus trituberculatus]|uniref:Uncharacterized protein n=1 Tax=Portunus trituberculatus TaxID=210409 RepID=A0A5B7HPP6_PORTR|nr:hypothetical protein [Portunus trituberculatus]
MLWRQAHCCCRCPTPPRTHTYTLTLPHKHTAAHRSHATARCGPRQGPARRLFKPQYSRSGAAEDLIHPHAPAHHAPRVRERRGGAGRGGRRDRGLGQGRGREPR